MAVAFDPASLAIGSAVGLVVGAVGAWLAARAIGARGLTAAQALLEQERGAMADRLAAEFRRLSTEALGANNRQFLDLARTQLEGYQSAARGDISQILQPVKESLAKVDRQISEIEMGRAIAYAKISQQVEDMARAHLRLGDETRKLVTAMRSPGVRGRWGELQLRRVIEMSGMLAYVDFREQLSIDTEEGRLRPDVVVQLPGRRTIVIDSKVPFDHYFEAASLGDSGDETAAHEALLRHARLVREHMAQLGRKAYWHQFDPSPDLVVMFLPDEGFFSAALRVDPGLVEAGLQNHVVPATPTTLIALLRTVEFGWRQESLTRNAREISENGAELYKRLARFGDHLQKVGRGLNMAVGSYNDAVGSLERQVLPSARRIKELKATHVNTEIPELGMIDMTARQLSAPELLNEPEEIMSK
jgi:DNA recombination protein RmuC